MWSLRRVSHPLRNHGVSIRVSAASFPASDQPTAHIQIGTGIMESPDLGSDRFLSFKGFHRRNHTSSNLYLVQRSLSSQADNAEGRQEEGDLDDEFSQVKNDDDDDDDSDPSSNDLEMSEPKMDSAENAASRRRAGQSLLQAMSARKGLTMYGALDKWVEEGNKLGRFEIRYVMANLRKLRMFLRAVQFSQWLEDRKHLEFTEMDYASRLDCIAKEHGLTIAERSITKIPKSFRGELVYRTLLANCVHANDARKAEQVFKKMRDLKFPLTAFACNQLLLLYKKTDKRKVPDVLLLMESENLKPTLFTYRLLIDIKGLSNDLQGLELLLERMKNDGIKQDWETKSIVVRHYIASGHEEKAKAILKEMSGDDLSETRPVCRFLLEHGGELGDAVEVSRVWEFCEKNPSSWEFIAAIRAWGKLKNIKKAEEVFEKMLKAVKKPNSRHYNSLLNVYVDNKMLDEGKDLVKRMAGNDVPMDPQTWDLLMKLYMYAGLPENADLILQKAGQQSKNKPMLFRSYLAIMDGYADRGDVHNAEKIFRRMKEAGFTAGLNQFQTLVRAYINAKKPAYGMEERIKANNLFPNKALAAQLAMIDSFRKTSVSNILD